MKETKLAILLVGLIAFALFLSYDAYLESQKQTIVDSFFEGYEEELSYEELEEIFNEDLFDLIDDT